MCDHTSQLLRSPVVQGLTAISTPQSFTLLTSNRGEKAEKDGGVMPSGQETQAFLEQHETHEENNRPDGRLVDDGPDEGDEAEP